MQVEWETRTQAQVNQEKMANQKNRLTPRKIVSTTVYMLLLDSMVRQKRMHTKEECSNQNPIQVRALYSINLVYD